MQNSSIAEVSANSETDLFDLPPEITTKPLPLIGISGLDLINNAVHKNIWEALSTNRRSDKGVSYKFLSNAHEFPLQKTKRTSYERYIPKGILKSNWLNKHLCEVPAVIAIFYDLEWSDIYWNEKIIECSSRVQSIRSAIDRRSIKIVVVLIQQMAPSDDTVAAERGESLCMSCDLPRKHLFVLSHGEHLSGYISRIEVALNELANLYYQQEIKTIKMHRDYLNKATHFYLYVRHQFKMGFFSELRQDVHVSFKHYTHAYNNLREHHLNEANIHEVRVVSAFINYKLCKVMFALNMPRDAITQLRTHIEHFRSQSGFKELMFEHYAWMSKQYCLFGDVFDEAIRTGLPAVQIQHPGFYYQQAAEYAVLRKQACLRLCQDCKSYPSPDPLESDQVPEFYGQRPWLLSGGESDQVEQWAIKALQWKERNLVNHSKLIITLYGHAISQFKTYKCPRMRRFLVIEMANEYMSNGDFSQAFTILTHMLYEYRKEKWFKILSHLFKKALYCAQMTANVQDFLSICLEILSDSVELPQDYKSQVLRCIYDVLVKKTPAINDLSEANSNYHQFWQSINVKESSPQKVVVDMKELTLPMQVKIKFTKTSFSIEQEVSIELFLRSCCSQVIKFNSISILLSTSKSQKELAVVSGRVYDQYTNPNFEFDTSGLLKKFIVRFKPETGDVGETYHVNSVLLKFGQLDQRQLILKYSGLGTEPCAKHLPYIEYQRSVTYPAYTSVLSNVDFNMITAVTNSHLTSRQARVAVNLNHEPPGLIGEWYPIEVILTNEELSSMLDIYVNVSVNCDENCVVDQVVELSLDGVAVHRSKTITYNLPEITRLANGTFRFYIRVNTETNIKIMFKMSYVVKLSNVALQNQAERQKHLHKKESEAKQMEKDPKVIKPKRYLEKICIFDTAFSKRTSQTVKKAEKTQSINQNMCLDLEIWRNVLKLVENNPKTPKIGFYKIQMLARLKAIDLYLKNSREDILNKENVPETLKIQNNHEINSQKHNNEIPLEVNNDEDFFYIQNGVERSIKLNKLVENINIQKSDQEFHEKLAEYVISLNNQSNELIQQTQAYFQTNSSNENSNNSDVNNSSQTNSFKFNYLDGSAPTIDSGKNSNENNNISTKEYSKLGVYDSSLYPSYMETDYTIKFVNPFDFTCKFYSELQKQLKAFYVNEPFIVFPCLTNRSSINLVIDQFCLDFNPTISRINENTSLNNGACLEPYGCLGKPHVSIIKEAAVCSQVISVGKLTVHWKRKNTTLPNNYLELDLGQMPVEINPICLDVKLPRRGVVLSPMSVTYCVRNNTLRLLQFSVEIHANERSFMFAGYKQGATANFPHRSLEKTGEKTPGLKACMENQVFLAGLV